MKIKEIILEGFKSYGERTTLSNLDTQFNAITGLNGSGKSNILEAICFVLGLQKWTLARVTNMRELIYKNGQAGIKQASVSIVFDNRNKAASPVNLEMYDEVKITRVIKFDSSSYYLNGKRETNANIKKIFKSIGLNIDNYSTFFVQQGRITSIVNFQPKELMNFLEETAGVSYYNVVKKDCINTMEKKDEKLRSANELIAKDIEPEIKNLEAEKIIIEEFNKIENELDQVKKKLIFYKKKQGQEELVRLERDIEKVNEDLVNFKKKLNMNRTHINRIDVGLREFAKVDSTEFAQMTKKGQDLKMNIDNLERYINGLSDTRLNVDEKLRKIETIISENRSKKDQKATDLNLYNRDIKFIDEEIKNNETELNELKARRGQDNMEKGYFEAKLNKLFEEKEVQENKKKVFLKKLDGLEREHKLIQDSKKDVNKQNGKLQEQLKDLDKEIRELKEDYSKRQRSLPNTINYDYELEVLENEIKKKVQTKREILGQHYHYFEIQYTDNPNAYLPSHAIKGKVHSLFKLKDAGKFINALEAIAGNKLFYIIVDSEITCKTILEKKLIRGRLDLIPNNRIRSKVIELHKMAECQHVARSFDGDVWQPMEVIEYPAELKPAFEFVFSGALIVSNAEIAEAIAYNPKLQIRCITLDGDVYDPSGTLDGGYRDASSSILLRSQETKEIIAEIDKLYKRKEEMKKEKNENKEIISQIEGLKNSISIKEKEKIVMEKKIEVLSISSINQKQSKIEEEIAFTTNELDAINKRLKRNSEEVDELKTHAEKGGNKSESFIKDKIAKLEVNNKKLAQDLAHKKQLLEDAKLALANFEEDLVENSQVIEKLKQEKQGIEDELNDNLNAKSTAEKNYMKLGSEIESENRQRVMQLNQKNQLDSDKLRFEQENANLESKKRQREDDLAKMQEYHLQLKADVKKQRGKGHETLSQELDIPVEQLLREIEKLESHQRKLEEKREQLAKRVNKDAEIKYDNVNKRYQQIVVRRTEINNNKETLKTSICTLDTKKIDTVDHCFHKVNANLGKIFSNLLPGAFAYMKLVNFKDKKTKEDQAGIEIRISFNGKEKESLSELSGGQRSLLALSFLLALLSYKPAPFYIFDEVDAALDLSHTENLGLLIAEHFPQSQFLVISLKEEFYNNANVLYKTSVLDGHSKVERYQKKNK